MMLLMLIADVLGFAVAFSLVYILSFFLRFFIFNVEEFKYPVIPVMCLILFIYSKLYPSVGINPAEEIKLVTQYVTTGFVGGWIILILTEVGWRQNLYAFPVLWVFSILSILLARWSVRILAVRLGLWGEPVVVIGQGQHVDQTIRYFAERKRLGYIPVLAAVDTLSNQSQTCPVPVIEFSTLLASTANRFSRDNIHTALVDVPSISDFFRSDESKALFRLFRRVILVSDLDWIDGASMRIQDFEGIIGIAAEKGVLTPTNAFLKRALDIVVSIITGVLLSPVMFAAAIWIKLDSPGRVFYNQNRLGKDRRNMPRHGEHRRKIKIYKFRTMSSNSDSALKEYLRTNPKARLEWDANQKLRDDPRITGAGRFLRKFSLDELPQLFNVFKGDMSLVGPRPIMQDQLRLYGNNIEAYCGVRPGITGLWQVSGRNRTTFEERVRYDIYYIRNWSVWLDFYILLRTVWVVLHKEGAY
jgi:Undecaprenyl-phosphate galactose phosphotransferase WbaP